MARTIPARESGPQHIHFIRSRLIVAGDDATVIKVGTIPAGAQILKPISGLDVHVAFDGTTLADIGTAADGDLYMTDAVTTAIAFVPVDEAVSMLVTADTEITVTLTGGTVTVGSATAVIAYTINK